MINKMYNPLTLRRQTHLYCKICMDKYWRMVRTNICNINMPIGCQSEYNKSNCEYCNADLTNSVNIRYSLEVPEYILSKY